MLRKTAVIAAALVAGGCASSRYVGSISPTGVYSNLGYGIALDLQASELSARWQVIDPEDPSAAPRADWPEILDAPLDLDGDGVLAGSETSRHLRPTLRLLARSATASGARIDIDVVILGGEEAGQTLAAVADAAARELISPEAVGSLWEKSTVPSGFEAWTTATRTHRLVVIDQKDFAGERTAQPRRQTVRVLLVAPAITDTLRADHDRVVRALSLAAKGGPIGRQDTW